MVANDYSDIENMLGRDLSEMTEKQFERKLSRAFDYWRCKQFPYEKITKDELHKEYLKFENSDCRNLLTGGRISSSTLGLRLANSFHPQMWSITSQGHRISPIEHFNNDETLLKLLRRAVDFWPSRHCWSAYCIRNLFRIYSGGRVSNFRPTVSKLIIEKFSSEHSRILDFCSGFGGRLLGALSLNRHYVGIDASPKQFQGGKSMYQALRTYSRGSAEFHNGCAEDLMSKMKSHSFDLIFTSPPYFNTEKYCTKSNQSYRRYISYEDWKEKFLKSVITQSHRLLSIKGYLVVNIANIARYPIAKDFEVMCEEHFHLRKKLFLDLHSRPVQKSRGNAYKFEPIYVMQPK